MCLQPGKKRQGEEIEWPKWTLSRPSQEYGCKIHAHRLQSKLGSIFQLGTTWLWHRWGLKMDPTHPEGAHSWWGEAQGLWELGEHMTITDSAEPQRSSSQNRRDHSQHTNSPSGRPTRQSPEEHLHSFPSVGRESGAWCRVTPGDARQHQVMKKPHWGVTHSLVLPLCRVSPRREQKITGRLS